MRAIGVQEYGGPEALSEVDLVPEPLGDDQIRLTVTAVGVNPTDTGLRSGGYSGADAPDGVEVPGMDVAGVVAEVGSAADTDLVVGDRVMAVVVPAGEHGGYREDVVLPVGSVVATPGGLSDHEAASIPMNALTARYALEQLALPAGATLLVTGAAGALGGCLVQLAKVDGLRVVADASESDRELLEQLGADVVVPRGDGFADAVRTEAPDGVDAVADAALLAESATALVRDGGGVATFRGWDGDGDERLAYHPVLVMDVAERHDWLEEIRGRVESGELTARVADVVPASRAREAHERLEAGGVRGRLILTWQ